MRRSDREMILNLLEVDPSAALAHARDLIAEDDSDPDLMAFEAEALGELGAFPAAIDAWARYLALDPDHLPAYCERIRLLVELGRFKAAHGELLLADDLFPAAEELAWVRGFWLEAQGELEEADRHFARAVGRSQLEVARVDRDAAAAAIQRQIGDGFSMQMIDMPADVGGEGLGRAFEMKGPRQVVIYARNIERELLPGDAEDGFVDAFMDAWAGAERGQEKT